MGRKTVYIHRVGTITAGITLVLTGVLFLVRLFFPFFARAKTFYLQLRCVYSAAVFACNKNFSAISCFYIKIIIQKTVFKIVFKMQKYRFCKLFRSYSD